MFILFLIGSVFANTSQVEDELPIEIGEPSFIDVVITSNANEGGFLKIGDTIEFEIRIKEPIHSAVVMPIEYNGAPLNWNTEDDRKFYATYTVEVGHEDQITPLQIKGVRVYNKEKSTHTINGTDIKKK